MVRGPTVVVCAAVIFAPSLGVGSPAAAQPVVRELTVVPGVEGSYPSWAPETGTLVFHVEDEGREGLYEVRLDGTGLRRITAAPDETPVWSPDGTHVAFRRTLNGNGEVFLHEAGEGEAVNLTRHPATDFHPKFSPDGSRIVFESNRAGGDNFEVYEMGLDGTFTRPVWSPDGSRIVCTRSRNGREEIVVLRLDGLSSPAPAR